MDGDERRLRPSERFIAGGIWVAALAGAYLMAIALSYGLIQVGP